MPKLSSKTQILVSKSTEEGCPLPSTKAQGAKSKCSSSKVMWKISKRSKVLKGLGKTGTIPVQGGNVALIANRNA